jgi:hypothetical protein
MLSIALSIQAIVQNDYKTAQNIEIEKLTSKLTIQERTLNELELNLAILDKYAEEQLYTEVSLKIAAIKNLILQLSRKVASAQFSHKNVLYYLGTFIQELKQMEVLSQETCRALEYTNTNTGKPYWVNDRGKITACGRMQHPSIENVYSVNELINASRIRLCPSRKLLDQYILTGHSYSINPFCFGAEDVKEHVHFPVYNRLCSIYHMLEGCARSEHLKPVPNVNNIFSVPVVEEKEK